MKCITGSIARGLSLLPVLYQSEKDYIPILGRIFDIGERPDDLYRWAFGSLYPYPAIYHTIFRLSN